MKDVIIIGAGCAGMTASIYAKRAGLDASVFEKYIYGGQMFATSRIENYPSFENITGSDLAEKMYSHAVALGADIRFEDVVSADILGDIKTIRTTNGEYKSKSVIIANGVSQRLLGCEGEKEFTGKGVSYCATCDGAFFKEKIVAIVGAGSSALEDALFLSNNCEKVYLIHRRDEFTGEKVLQDAVRSAKNIEILTDTQVRKINGENIVNSILTENTKSHELKEIAVSGLFIAIGRIPNNGIFEGLSLDEKGYIIAGEDCKTNIDGVFAAGDCRTKQLRQIITAAADGAAAAVSAGSYIATLK